MGVILQPPKLKVTMHDERVLEVHEMTVHNNEAGTGHVLRCYGFTDFVEWEVALFEDLPTEGVARIALVME